MRDETEDLKSGDDGSDLRQELLVEGDELDGGALRWVEIGRASCRERV